MDSNDIRPDRDFKKLNKMAISSKLHRSEVTVVTAIAAIQ
jgi:hypothetical protein